MQHRKRNSARLVRAAAATLAGAAAMLPAASWGVDRYWVNSSLNSTWNAIGNWSVSAGGGGGASVPASGDVAFLSHSDATSRNTTLDITTTVIGLNIGNNGAGTSTFTQTAAVNLTTSGYVAIGHNFNGHGVFVQSAGTNTIGTTLDVGFGTGSTGQYNLSGTGTVNVLSNGGDLTIGDGGNGTFNQSGGTVNVANIITNPTLYVGYAASGTYNLSGTGFLNVFQAEHIGYVAGSTGQFTQTGGTHTVTSLFMGYNNGSNGSYNLSGTGRLTVTNGITVGHSAGTVGSTATFTQSGGTHTNDAMYVAYNGGTGTASGKYVLSAGTLNTSTQTYLGYNNGTGFAANATFDQTGGTHTATTLSMASGGNTTAIYTLSGTANLVTTETTIADVGRATFAQTGGTHTTTRLNTGTFTGGTATYALSGTGVLSVSGFEEVSNGSTMTQSGGTHTVGAPGSGLGSSGLTVEGSYNLSGGTLLSHGYTSIDMVNPTTTFTQTGGTHTVGTPGGQGGLFIIAGATQGTFGTYSLSGTGSVNVNGIAHLGGLSIPDVAGQLGGMGVLNIGGGSMTVTGSIKIWDTSGTALNLSAGTLSVGSFEGAGGRLNWTGGTLTITNPAGLAVGPTALLPSITLSAGKTLNVAALALNTGGTVTLSGGALNYASALNLAGGTVNGTAAFNNAGQINGFGTIGGSGGFTNSGGVNINAGNLVLSKTGALANSGTISLVPGSQLQLTGGNLANTALITLGGGTISGAATLSNNIGGVIAGFGTISAPLLNSAGATILLQTGTLFGSAITNNGVIRGDGLLMNALTNAATGEIRAENGKWLTINAMSSANNGKINLQGGTVEFNAALTNVVSGLITGRGTIRANAGLTNNGQMQLVADFSDVYGTVIGSSGSKVIVSGNAAATFYNNVTMNAGSEFRVSTGSIASFFAPVTGASFFTGGGMKDFQAGSSIVGQIITAGGSTMVQKGASLTATVIRESSLEADGVVTIAPDGSNAATSRIESLTVLDGGRLNLTNNKLIIAGADLGSWTGSAYTGTTGLIASGRNGGTLPLWDGSGIVTSQTSATGGNFHSLAVSTATDAGRAGGNFGGIPVAGPDILVMYTYGGDANLDGKLNIDDYVRIDQGIAANLKGWSNGDFNYDGKINIDDYTTVIDSNIGNQGGFVFPSAIAATQRIASVPEPSIGVSLITFGVALHMRRRHAR